MSLLDHRKTWSFELTAPPDACIHAFIAVLRSRKLRQVNWHISHSHTDTGEPLVTGTYRGRGGFAAFATAVFGKRAQDVEQTAMGSEISFVIEDHDPKTGMTICTLWMSSRGTQFGLTADASYYRSYMHGVARALAALDPDLRIAKA